MNLLERGLDDDTDCDWAHSTVRLDSDVRRIAMKDTSAESIAIETDDSRGEQLAERLPDFDASDLELEQRLNFEHGGYTTIAYC
jgi:hypothetical protein